MRNHKDPKSVRASRNRIRSDEPLQIEITPLGEAMYQEWIRDPEFVEWVKENLPAFVYESILADLEKTGK